MLDLDNKKVTIIGAKRSGIAAAELVLKKKGIPRISDGKDFSKLPEECQEAVKDLNIECEFGNNSNEFIKDSDIIVLSPGVSIFSDIVKFANDNNIPVLGEIEFAYQFCTKPVIAITGSNGKTTVSTLTDLVINAAGFRSCLCGNVGYPFSRFVLKSYEVDYFVLEVSSFQMESLINEKEGFVKFKPKVAVLLNFSQNHLDRHKDMQEYFEAKTNIFKNQDSGNYAVINSKMQNADMLAEQINSEIVYFDKLNCKDFSENQRAVFAAVSILGIDKSICDKIFADFKGVEHRLENVRYINGVSFVNDSKATTVESGRWALEHINGNIIMICGGRDKNLDFASIKSLARDKVKKMIVFGEAKEKISNVFKDVVDVSICSDLKESVELAKGSSSAGDTVLLSPMCASFDMFDNYEHRGKVFKKIVNNLE